MDHNDAILADCVVVLERDDSGKSLPFDLIDGK